MLSRKLQKKVLAGGVTHPANEVLLVGRCQGGQAGWGAQSQGSEPLELSCGRSQEMRIKAEGEGQALGAGV